MLESFERAEAVRGDRAFSEYSAKDSLFNTKSQRLKLNLQLVYIRELMQQDIERAPNITPRPSVTDSEYSSTAFAIEDEIEKGGSSPVSDSRRPDYSVDATMRNGKRPNYDDESMVVRRVALESSYGHIPEAHRNTLAQAGNHAHQSSNTTNDSRTRITDILNEPSLSGAGGLKNPDDAPMKIASEPPSPRNAPLTSQRNPDNGVMDINSVPPSPVHQSVSLGSVPASGSNPEDSSMSIQSVPPSPAHEPEDAALDEFASIDGANAGAEIDVDLYDADYDSRTEDLQNTGSTKSIGAEDEEQEDSDVQLP